MSRTPLVHEVTPLKPKRATKDLQVFEKPSFRFQSSFQGEIEYELAPKLWKEEKHTFQTERNHHHRIQYRYATLNFDYKPFGEKYWNYQNEEEFERKFNSTHLLLRNRQEPVSKAILEAFQNEVDEKAQTGFYCHIRNRWIKCKPTHKNPSRKTYEVSKIRKEKSQHTSAFPIAA